MKTASRIHQGALMAVSAYGLWALTPVYFKALYQLPAVELLAQRVIWSFLLTLMLVFLFKKHRQLVSVLREYRSMKLLFASTVFIGANWGVFIWSVLDGRILSASLGYYINPLISVLLGVVFLQEKLSPARKIAVMLCVVAVIFELVSFGHVPIVALFLAVSFGLYGLLRKKAGVDSLVGLTIEMGLSLPFALLYLFLFASEMAVLVNNSWHFNLLLILSGPVTAIPLLLFSAAANRISLSALGFFQYIAPSGMFALAVFVYDEELHTEKLITFALIWCALALLVVEGVRSSLSARESVIIDNDASTTKS